MVSLLKLALIGGAAALAPQRTPSAKVSAEPARREFIQGTAATAAGAAALAGLPAASSAAPLAIKNWERVSLPVSTTLFDIAFDTDTHGYLVGAKGTFLETVDGGKNWKPRTFANLDEEEEVGYRFEKVSFQDGEGWVVGKPPILLHTVDAASRGSGSR
ncbi:hypothetical protein JL721_7556 [Aureococcus anophagefferens]|nr:hypothetical protein JL721_7556 [Aureococcus anophagefferens]